MENVAAYLSGLDISNFDSKAPPPKTPAFWAIVDANQAPEESELADVLDKLGWPDATTINELALETSSADFATWLRTGRTAAPSRTALNAVATSRSKRHREQWPLGYPGHPTGGLRQGRTDVARPLRRREGVVPVIK